MARLRDEREADRKARELLCEGLQEHPFQNEEITEVLSQWILMHASCQLPWTSHRMASSTVTASAQPMSQLSWAHPSRIFQASHLSPVQRPRPQEVDASTHRSRSDLGSGMRACEGLGTASVVAHHDSMLVQGLGML